MGVTLNKDGTPRKIGSGKTKGAGCFAKIKWQHLREFIKEDADILVSRVWLRSVGALNQKKGFKKKLNAPATSHNTNKDSPVAERPQKKYRTLPNRKAQPSLPVKRDEDDYEPPPLFASMGEIKKY